MDLPSIVKGGKKLVRWLDGMPSVPVACGAFLLGLLVPMKLLFIAVIIFLIYAAIQYMD